MEKLKRIESLDWLRGFMAIAIMLYHLTGWIFKITWEADSILGKFGIYSVSIFFILSGLSMAIVYNRYIVNIQSSVFFIVRRIFRIWPLLWICIVLVIVPFILKNGITGISEPWKIFINMTTLFGFIDPSNYINAGAWSIGNEMVYYALTPLIIIIFNKKKIFGNIFALFTFIVSLVFAFHIMDNSKSLSDQWTLYINPFNNFSLYVIGIAIYYNFRKIRLNNYVFWSLGIISILIFTLYPISGDQINLVTKFNRVVFILASIILVLFFYKIPVEIESKIPKFLKYIFEKFGIATYGIYLLHPVVLLYWRNMLERINISNQYITFFGCVVLTIVGALISFNLIESKIMAIGKKITSTKA